MADMSSLFFCGCGVTMVYVSARKFVTHIVHGIAVCDDDPHVSQSKSLRC